MPYCPRGTNILDSFDGCGFSCPSGLEPSTQDDSYCVRTSCPPLSTVDENDNAVCWKNVTVKINNCETGFTEWTPNECYKDCPPNYHENGQTCIKPSVKRRTTSLECGPFQILNGNKCNLSPYVLIIIFIILLIILGVYIFLKNYHYQKLPSYLTP
jgi:hypothetical protein